MIDLDLIDAENMEDMTAVSDWYTEIYDNKFAGYFGEQRELFNRLKSKRNPITDTELEWILTEVPIHLFDVSEELNAFKLSQEVLKMKTKQKEAQLAEKSSESSETKRKEAAALQVLEDKLLITVYSAVISRVESEVSFSRELIMSAKKIWDGRRNAERCNPVSEHTSPELPDYDTNGDKRKNYIRGV